LSQESPVSYANPALIPVVSENVSSVKVIYMWIKPSPWIGGAMKVPFKPGEPMR
jgi:hypothetical protein